MEESKIKILMTPESIYTHLMYTDEEEYEQGKRIIETHTETHTETSRVSEDKKKLKAFEQGLLSKGYFTDLADITGLLLPEPKYSMIITGTSEIERKFSEYMKEKGVFMTRVSSFGLDGGHELLDSEGLDGIVRPTYEGKWLDESGFSFSVVTVGFEGIDKIMQYEPLIRAIEKDTPREIRTEVDKLSKLMLDDCDGPEGWISDIHSISPFSATGYLEKACAWKRGEPILLEQKYQDELFFTTGGW